MEGSPQVHVIHMELEMEILVAELCQIGIARGESEVLTRRTSSRMARNRMFSVLP